MRADEDFAALPGRVLQGTDDTGLARTGCAFQDDDPPTCVGQRLPQVEDGVEGSCRTGQQWKRG